MPKYLTLTDVSESVYDGINIRKQMVQGMDQKTSKTLLIPESRYAAAFGRVLNDSIKARNAKGAQDNLNVSRRSPGFVPKRDGYAMLKVVDPNNNLYDQSGSSVIMATTNFSLQSVQEVTEEKYQLIETFGEPVGFFYGQRPKIYRYGGFLVNAANKSWRDEWKSNYESLLRGSKLASKGYRAYLTYDYVLREGYILDTGINQIAAKPNDVDFNFTMFITREINLAPSIADSISSGSPYSANAADKASREAAENSNNEKKEHFIVMGEERAKQQEELIQKNGSQSAAGEVGQPGASWDGNSAQVPRIRVPT